MKRMLIFVGASVFLFAPLSVFASSHLGLVPTCEYGAPFCQGCDLVKLFDNLLRFAVYFSTVIATLMFAYAGFLYVTAAAGGEGNLTKAKDIFGKVLLGFVFVLSAWLIVNVLMNVFLDTGQTKYPWNEIQCEKFFETTTFVNGPPPIDSDLAGSPGGFATVAADTLLSHDDALSQFDDGDVDVTTTNGPGGVQPGCTGVGCTSLTGIQQRTVDNTVNLKAGCGINCDVIVTGATERGVHVSGNTDHEAGFKVDLQATQTLNNYIQSSGKFTSSGPVGGNSAYKDVCGNTYVRVGSHWDVTVVQTCKF